MTPEEAAATWCSGIGTAAIAFISSAPWSIPLQYRRRHRRRTRHQACRGCTIRVVASRDPRARRQRAGHVSRSARRVRHRRAGTVASTSRDCANGSGAFGPGRLLSRVPASASQRRSFCYEWTSRSSEFQRTANRVLTGGLPTAYHAYGAPISEAEAATKKQSSSFPSKWQGEFLRSGVPAAYC